MKETVIRIKTLSDEKQKGTMVMFHEMKDGNYNEFSFGEYSIEYFDKQQVRLEDGDYPESMFDPVFLAASLVAPGSAIPTSNYRGLQIKEEHRKYKDQEE